jgi:hypothetical protein
MAEANAAFLRGRADAYRRTVAVNADSPAVAEYLRLAELWDAEADAIDAEQAKQPAPSIMRRPATTAVLSIRKQAPADAALKRA